MKKLNLVTINIGSKVKRHRDHYIDMSISQHFSMVTINILYTEEMSQVLSHSHIHYQEIKHGDSVQRKEGNVLMTHSIHFI